MGRARPPSLDGRADEPCVGVCGQQGLQDRHVEYIRPEHVRAAALPAVAVPREAGVVAIPGVAVVRSRPDVAPHEPQRALGLSEGRRLDQCGMGSVVLGIAQGDLADGLSCSDQLLGRCRNELLRITPEDRDDSDKGTRLTCLMLDGAHVRHDPTGRVLYTCVDGDSPEDHPRFELVFASFPIALRPPLRNLFEPICETAGRRWAMSRCGRPVVRRQADGLSHDSRVLVRLTDPRPQQARTLRSRSLASLVAGGAHAAVVGVVGSPRGRGR